MSNFKFCLGIVSVVVLCQARNGFSAAADGINRVNNDGVEDEAPAPNSKDAELEPFTTRTTNDDDDEDEQMSRRLRSTGQNHYLRALRSNEEEEMRAHFLRSLRSGPQAEPHFLRSLKSQSDHFLRSIKAEKDNKNFFLRPLRSQPHFLRALRSQPHFLRPLRATPHFLRPLRSVDLDNQIRNLRSEDAPVNHFLRSLRSFDGHLLRALRSPNEKHFLRALRGANDFDRSGNDDLETGLNENEYYDNLD